MRDAVPARFDARIATARVSLRQAPRSWSLWLVAALGACARRPAVDSACGREVPAAELWAERSDGVIEADIQRARTCARANGRRVLLEFVATWCDDCRAMTDIDQTPAVREVIRRRYEHVRINVTDWNGHAALRERFGVDRIAAYRVLDPATGATVASTAMEPITTHTPVTPERWMAWLESPR